MKSKPDECHVQSQVTGKRGEGKVSEGACAEVFGAGEYETSIIQEKQDRLQTQQDLNDSTHDIKPCEENLKLNVRMNTTWQKWTWLQFHILT